MTMAIIPVMVENRIPISCMMSDMDMLVTSFRGYLALADAST